MSVTQNKCMGIFTWDGIKTVVNQVVLKMGPRRWARPVSPSYSPDTAGHRMTMSGSTMSYMMWVHSPAPASLPFRPPPTVAPPTVPPANYAGSSLNPHPPPSWFSTMVSKALVFIWFWKSFHNSKAGLVVKPIEHSTGKQQGADSNDPTRAFFPH